MLSQPSPNPSMYKRAYNVSSLLAGLPTAPLTVPAVGSPTVPIKQSSGSPSLPTPSSQPVEQNVAGLPTAPLTVHTVGSPTVSSTRSSGSPSVPSLPPPPPWSVHLPKCPATPGTVICGKCLGGCHGLQFQMCYACYGEKGNPRRLYCILYCSTVIMYNSVSL